MTFNSNAAIISDLYKEANGFRPSAAWMKSFIEMSQVGQESLMDDLERQSDSEAEHEREREDRAYTYWSNQIYDMTITHNISFADAIRWDMQAEDAVGEISFYCFRRGLAYRCEDEISRLLKE